MNFKLIMAILTGFVAVVYCIQWYNGVQIPAWQALIWVLVVFIRDLDDYFQDKLRKTLDSLS